MSIRRRFLGIKWRHGNIPQNVIYNPDGSVTEQYVAYDENGNPISGSNITTDTEGNVSTQEIEYDSNGNPEVVSYNIDTTTGDGTGMDIVNSVDTGFIAFDGKKFICTGDVEFSTQEQGTSVYKTLISALELISGSSYKGFYIRNTSLYQIGMYGSNEGLTLAANGTGGYSIGNAVQILKARQRYTFTLTYEPGTSSGKIVFIITPTGSSSGTVVNNNSGTISQQSSSLPPTMNNAKITLGGNGLNSAHNMVNMVVYAFNVHKIV